MATFNLPNTSAEIGVPTQGEDIINPGYIPLITGNEPALFQADLTVAASQNIPAYTPVGFDGSGNLVPAVSGTTQAIGITFNAVVTPGSGALKGAPIYRAGCFNPDALNWPASYDTVEKKFEAFRGAPSPTMIELRAPKTATV